MTTYTIAASAYALAHALHYGSKEYGQALTAYARIRLDHPESREADYARAQIRNIVRATVPAQLLLDMQAALAQDQLDAREQEAAS